MNSESRSGPSRLTLFAYRVVLRCYPATFRRRYEAEMVDAFREEWAAASGKGTATVIGYATHLLWDIVRTVPREWSAVTS